MAIKRIAYLAPEIPSLSATFVYEEILGLERQNLQVTPISVHYPNLKSGDTEVDLLLERTTYLYRRPWLLVGLDNLKILFKKPRSYCLTLFIVLSDIISLGLIKLVSIKLLYHFLQAGAVAKLILDKNCQHLHIHFAHFPTQIGMYAASLSQIPFSFTSHANDIFENSLLLDRKIARAKVAITISEYNKKLLEKETQNHEKIKVIRCGIDQKKYLFEPKSIISEGRVIKSLGRLVEKKGMKTLIMAANELNQRGVYFSLVIGGDGLMKEELKTLVDSYNLNSKVSFAGAIPHHQVFSWLQDADIFILACQQDSKGDRDGIPVVLMEAMAVGIPVISTQISGIPELIQDRVSGYLAPPANPILLADTIEQLLNEPNLSQVTQRARQKILEEFEINSTVNHLLNCFNLNEL